MAKLAASEAATAISHQVSIVCVRGPPTAGHLVWPHLPHGCRSSAS
jgi:hypothetical protein